MKGNKISTFIGTVIGWLIVSIGVLAVLSVGIIALGGLARILFALARWVFMG
jgi:hypothetical protein